MGSRILSLLLEDKQQAAKQLLDDFEDPSEGGAETEVLKAALRVTKAFSPKAQSGGFVLRMVPLALRRRGGSAVNDHPGGHSSAAKQVQPSSTDFL